jgi:hypothetical protein
MNEIEKKIMGWAKKHSEIIGLSLGGSRAKGTHTEKSDYDFSVHLNIDPTESLVEQLTKDLMFDKPEKIIALGKTNRHFTMLLRAYKCEPEIAVAFVNENAFIDAMENEADYVIASERFEFLKTAKILLDVTGKLKEIQKLEYPGWIRKNMLRECKGHMSWNFEKYEKALLSQPFTAMMMKLDCMWYMVKAVALINHITIDTKYDYEKLKKTLKSLEASIVPSGFFETIESCSVKDDIHNLKEQLSNLKKTIDSIIK